MRSRYIAFAIFLTAFLYLAAPYFFEKKLFLNEVLAGLGFVLLMGSSHRKFMKTPVMISVLLLLGVGIVHALISAFRADGLYYYLRNLVILYSIFSFFVGYYLFSYLPSFLRTFRSLISTYVLGLLFVPVPGLVYDRFSMAIAFPFFGRAVAPKLVLPVIIVLSVIYSQVHESSTSLAIVAFFLLIWIFKSYRFFMVTIVVALVSLAALFIYLLPYLGMNPNVYSYYNTVGIWELISRHPLLGVDPNSTWRLVLWKQLLVDLFPENLLGIGFGTPALRYFPIEDYTKLDTLPYVIGAHNSFIYLFTRLGLPYVFIVVYLYASVFKEYYYNRAFYRQSYGVIYFYGFFAVSVIAFFNPVLETPIYASAYYILLGFLARQIEQKRLHDYHAIAAT